MYFSSLVRFSSKFIGVFIISTADYSLELLFLVSAVGKTKNSLEIDESSNKYFSLCNMNCVNFMDKCETEL